MLQRLARLVAAVGVVCAMPAYALGLGEVEVRSRLNQAFSASIPVLDASAQDLETLQVVMASPADFERVGIERADYLSSLTLTLGSGVGGARVQVSSTKISHDPFLDFLVEVRWQGGHLLREYTVLLDPPDLPGSPSTASAANSAPSTGIQESVLSAKPALSAQSTSGALNAASSSAAAGTAGIAPAPDTDVRFDPPEPDAASRPAPSNGRASARAARAARTVDHSSADDASGANPDRKTYGPVGSAETLWSIAGTVRPQSASTDQTLLALGLANPHAFARGRFNGLLSGVTLTVPSETKIESVPPEVAKARIAQWRSGGRLTVEDGDVIKGAPGSGPASTAATQSNAETNSAAAGTRSSSAAAPDGEAGQSLSAPSTLTGPKASVSTPPADPNVAASRANAVVDSTKAVGATAPSASTAASTNAVVASPASPAAPIAASPPTAATTTADGNAGGAASGGPENPIKTGPIAQAPAQTPGSGSDHSVLLLWLLAILLILLLGFIVWRATRSKEESQSPASAARPTLPVAPTPSAPRAAPGSLTTQASPTSASDLEASHTLGATSGFVKQTTETQPFSAAPDTVAAPAATTVIITDKTVAAPPQKPPQKESAQFGANDLLSEVDFHLAYGLHDEAISLLLHKLEKEPARKDMRIKLAETYFAARKAPEFQQTALALRDQVSETDWQKLAAMGREIAPDTSAFLKKNDAPPTAARQPSTTSDFAAEREPTNRPDFAFNPATLLLSDQHAPSQPAASESNRIDFDSDAASSNAQPKMPNARPAATQGLELESHRIDSHESPPAPAVDLPSEVRSDRLETSRSFAANIVLRAEDEIGTKLDLARAYADMGDNLAAAELLREVAAAGNPAQQQEAETLTKRLHPA